MVLQQELMKDKRNATESIQGRNYKLLLSLKTKALDNVFQEF